MEVERSSMCNCVVNFLLEENYLLTAFELLHELLDDGRDHLAIRLKEYFSDPALFPPEQISRFNSLTPMDPQTLLEEKEAAEEKLAFREYELRLAQEDIAKLKSELSNHMELPQVNRMEPNAEGVFDEGLDIQRPKKDAVFSDLGPLTANERRDLNFAVKEYLLMAGYRLTAMTFYEEVTDQNLDAWKNSAAHVQDALRHYYYQYLSSTTKAAEEKVALLRDNERLKREKDALTKSKDLADVQISALTKSVEALQKDLNEKEKLVQDLKQVWGQQRKELNDCRAEITTLKMHVEGSCPGENAVPSDVNPVQPHELETCIEETKSMYLENDKPSDRNNTGSSDAVFPDRYSIDEEDKDVKMDEDKVQNPHPSNQLRKLDIKVSESLSSAMCATGKAEDQISTLPENRLHLSENLIIEAALEKKGLGTIQILADSLPKIVPNVLIKSREELLPLIMCAIERHPDSSTRDSLTHTLFNLILRPDEKQRRIIMDACVSLSKNVGEMRTETELLPQCWEQINHTHEERRLLVAQSCGELAEFVRPEIRDSLILSIAQQLVEDSATVVREAAAHNLAVLLPLFPNTDKYFKALMFQLACDPSGVVVETTLRELLPALITWGNKLDSTLRVLMSHLLSAAQRCPPFSGVEGSVQSQLRVLGERERWNIDVLLRMLLELLPYVHQKAIETCPFSSIPGSGINIFSDMLLELYAREHVEWPAFTWLHVDCFPDLIKLVSLLPQKEDSLRNRITKFLLAVSERFGDAYLTHIVVPVFFSAVGENADLTFFPSNIHHIIKGLKPRSFMAERLAALCVLPLLLAGVLGAPSKRAQLEDYLRKLLAEDALNENKLTNRLNEIVNAVRFLCIFEEHHGLIFNILWEMVVSFDVQLKIRSASLLKVIVPYIDAKVASARVLPALVTLGSDQNLNVKYASIDAFGAVAQHFRNDMIVDKIQVQMDAFLEDGSHETTVAVVRALVIAVPHTSDKLRDYLLSKIFQLSGMTFSGTDVMRRRQRADVFCEAIRALDATDISANGIRDFLLPAIQNLLRDPDALDPAHKEALEIIMKERSGGTLETISKVMGMGAHLGLASSVTSFFGEGGLRSKKETVVAEPSPEPAEPPKLESAGPVDDTRFRRIMMGNFTEMLRGKGKEGQQNL